MDHDRSEVGGSSETEGRDVADTLRWTHLNPAGLPDWGESFSQVVIVDQGPLRRVQISGQVAVDDRNRVQSPGDLDAQAPLAFANLARALEAAGAGPRDVLRLGIYIVDYRPEQAETVRLAMRSVFRDRPLPTSTWLGVQALALPDLRIEVEATALLRRTQSAGAEA